jgi:hypothetical protein
VEFYATNFVNPVSNCEFERLEKGRERNNCDLLTLALLQSRGSGKNQRTSHPRMCYISFSVFV